MFMLNGKTVVVKVFKDRAHISCDGVGCDAWFVSVEEFYNSLADGMRIVNNRLSYPLFESGTRVRIKNAKSVFLNSGNWVTYYSEYIAKEKLVYYNENDTPTQADCELEYVVDYNRDGTVFISTYLKNINSYRCFVMAAEGLEIIENEEDN